MPKTWYQSDLVAGRLDTCHGSVGEQCSTCTKTAGVSGKHRVNKRERWNMSRRWREMVSATRAWATLQLTRLRCLTPEERLQLRFLSRGKHLYLACQSDTAGQLLLSGLGGSFLGWPASENPLLMCLTIPIHSIRNLAAQSCLMWGWKFH